MATPSGYTLTSEFKKLIAPDVMPCPDPIVNRELMSTLIDFCKETNVITKWFGHEVDSDYIETEDVVDYYDINLTGLVHSMRASSLNECWIDGVEWPKLQERDLTFDVPDWEAIKDNHTRYFHFPNNLILRLYDMDSSMSNLYLAVSFQPLRTATYIPDLLFEDWSDAIVAGAKWKILMMPGKEWTDSRAAEMNRIMYRRYKSQAAAQFLRGHSGKTQGINWQSFED